MNSNFLKINVKCFRLWKVSVRCVWDMCIGRSPATIFRHSDSCELYGNDFTIFGYNLTIQRLSQATKQKLSKKRTFFPRFFLKTFATKCVNALEAASYTKQLKTTENQFHSNKKKVITSFGLSLTQVPPVRFTHNHFMIVCRVANENVSAST